MIHKYKMDDSLIVLDVNSGSVHVVDQMTWEILDLYEQFSEESIIEKLKDKFYQHEIIDGLKEIKELVEEGLLFSKDNQQETYFLPVKPVVKSLCLHIAHDCNLRCKYCFASTGHFGGERTLMSVHTGKTAIDFLIEHSGSRKHCEIDFFGGEPLMNWETVKEIVNYGKMRAIESGKEFKFTLTTNGVLLDEEKTEFLNKENISVVLSLDGRRQVNDKMRSFPNGKGCYDTIVPKLKHFAHSRGDDNYYIRGTFTHYNLDFADDVEHMVELGFSNISVEPVVAPPSEDYAFRDEDLPVLKEQYDILTSKYLNHYFSGKEYNFFHFNLDLNGGPCLPKRLSGCGAGHEYLAVDPEGKLYPCHQFVGKPEYLIGTVENGIGNDNIMKDFQSAHIYNKEKCLKCWAKFYCSGGCHANAVAANGNLLQPYETGCDLARKRLECAIYIQARKAINV